MEKKRRGKRKSAHGGQNNISRFSESKIIPLAPIKRAITGCLPDVLKIKNGVASQLRTAIINCLRELLQDAVHFTHHCGRATLTIGDILATRKLRNQCYEVGISHLATDEDIRYLGQGKAILDREYSITMPAIKRIGASVGIIRMSSNDKVLNEINRIYKRVLCAIVTTAAEYTSHAKRKTVTTDDVNHALENLNIPKVVGNNSKSGKSIKKTELPEEIKITSKASKIRPSPKNTEFTSDESKTDFAPKETKITSGVSKIHPAPKDAKITSEASKIIPSPKEIKIPNTLSIIGPVESFYFKNIDRREILLLGDCHSSLDFKSCGDCVKPRLNTTLDLLRKYDEKMPRNVKTTANIFKKISRKSTPLEYKKCLFIYEWLLYLARNSHKCIDLFVEKMRVKDYEDEYYGIGGMPLNCFLSLVSRVFSICVLADTEKTRELARFCYQHFPALRYHSSDIRIKPYPIIFYIKDMHAIQTDSDVFACVNLILKHTLQNITNPDNKLTIIDDRVAMKVEHGGLKKQLILIRKQYKKSTLDTRVIDSILHVSRKNPNILFGFATRGYSGLQSIKIRSNGKLITVAPDFYINAVLQAQLMNWYTLFRMFAKWEKQPLRTLPISEKCKVSMRPGRIIFYGGRNHTEWFARVISHYFNEKYINVYSANRCLEMRTPFRDIF